MHASNSSTSTHRARWAAIGAAVAVSLGAGGLGIVNATSPDGASAYVPISPCRLLDTRADSPVGSPLGALGPDTEITVNGWGAQGNCTLPSDSTGLELNVTAVDASTLTNLRIYPEGVDTPTASNLNPAPGEPPTPNSVTAPLNVTNGQFHVFNRFGTVHIVIDVVGYFTDHMHDGEDIIDESLTGADVDNSSLTRNDILDEPGIAFSHESSGQPIAAGPNDYASVDLHAPSTGYVNVQVTAQVTFSGEPDQDNLLCGINTAPDATGDFTLVQQNNHTAGYNEIISMHRTFNVSAAGEQHYYFVCTFFGGAGDFGEIEITATYLPTWRGDISLGPIITIPPIITLAEDPADG